MQTSIRRIDDILLARRRLLPEIERKAKDASAQKDTIRELISLLEELRSLETEPAAFSLIDEKLKALQTLASDFSVRARRLQNLSRRFSRATVNIGVSGEARVGKSTTLQSLSGLGDTQIPTGKGLPVTAVRSEIYNSSDERAIVVFRDQRDFVTEYLTPLVGAVNEHLDQPLKITSLDDLRTALLPHTLGLNVDSVSTDALTRLSDAQRSLSTYVHLLEGGTKEVPLQELRHYVAYPSKKELDQEKNTARAADRSYIAVKSVQIYSRFPNLHNAKIGLIDLPGLGEISDSVAQMHLQGLEDGVDQVFLIMRPTDAEGYAKHGIANNIDQLRRVQLGVTRRGDLITAGINVTEGLDETIQTLKHDFEHKINGASTDPIRLLEYTAIDSESVRYLFTDLLSHIASKLPQMDQDVLEYTLAGEASEASVSQTLMSLDVAMTDLLRLIPLPEKLLLEQIQAISRGLIHDYNSLQKRLADQKSKHSNWYRAFDEDVRSIHGDIRDQILDGFFMGKDRWEIAAKGRKDYYNWFRDEAQRIRREIIASYDKLDDFYEDQVVQLKRDVLRIFFKNTGNLEQHFLFSPDQDPNSAIDDLAEEFHGTIQNDDLNSALELLREVRFSFRNNVFLQISSQLQELSNPSERFPKEPGGSKPKWENIRQVLGTVGDYEHQISRLQAYLTRIAVAANDGIRNSLLEHDDRFHQYLSVSAAFFNDFLYRKDEESFKHLVVRGLIHEYRNEILGADTANLIDQQKKTLIDEIKTKARNVGQHRPEPTTHHLPVKSNLPQPEPRKDSAIAAGEDPLLPSNGAAAAKRFLDQKDKVRVPQTHQSPKISKIVRWG